MESLQHDPRTKQQIKDCLFEYLYGKVKEQFQSRLDAIILKNASITGAHHLSFSYKGTLYATPGQGPAPRKMNRLSLVLVPYMDTYLADLKLLNQDEIPYVLGFITKVLNSSNDLHDYLLVLPSSVHPPIQGLIASCPCRTVKLQPEQILKLQEENSRSIALMKQRMVINLII